MFSVAMFFSLQLLSAQDEIGFNSLPSPIKNIFLEKYKNAEKSEWYKNADNTYFSTFQYNNKSFSLTITEQGKIVQTFKSTYYSELPEQIKLAFDKWNKDNWEISGIRMCEKENTTVTYQFSLLKEDDAESLIIDNNGTIIK